MAPRTWVPVVKRGGSRSAGGRVSRYTMSFFRAGRVTLDDANRACQQEDYKSAIRLLQTLARRGDPEAAERLADIYRNGTGVRPDFRLALKWYEKAAANKRSGPEVTGLVASSKSRVANSTNAPTTALPTPNTVVHPTDRENTTQGTRNNRTPAGGKPGPALARRGRLSRRPGRHLADMWRRGTSRGRPNLRIVALVCVVILGVAASIALLGQDTNADLTQQGGSSLEPLDSSYEVQN